MAHQAGPINQTDILGGTMLPFMFDNMPVRGKLLRLPNLTDQINALESGEQEVAHLLAEMLAAAVVFAFDLKEKANVSLQIITDSKLPLLLAKCNHKGVLRAYAEKAGKLSGPDVEATTLKEGVFTVTVDYGRGSQSYQSVVPINTASIAQTVESYFERSAQSPTYFKVFTGVDEDGRSSLGALFLQAMPGTTVEDDDWRRLGLILGTIQLAEILPGALSDTALLQRLFVEDVVRVFATQPLTFPHEGNRDRMLEALRRIGEEECRELLAEDGQIEMTDEYTGCREVFTAADIDALFTATEE